MTTGPDGTARATGLHVSKSGKFTITVAATLGALIAAEIIIHQSNGIIPLSSNPSAPQAGEPGNATSASTGSSTHHHFPHLGTKGRVVVAAAVVVVVTVLAHNNSTSLSLGMSTVTHP